MSKEEINHLIAEVKKDDYLLRLALSGEHNVLYASKELVKLASFYSITIPFILEAIKNSYPQLDLNPLYLKFCWLSIAFISGDPFKNFLKTLPGTKNKYHVLYGGGIDYFEKNATHKIGIYFEKNLLSGKFKVFIYDPSGAVHWIARILYQCSQSAEIESIFVWNFTIHKSAYGCDTFAISGICDIANTPDFFGLIETAMKNPDSEYKPGADLATVSNHLKRLVIDNKAVTIGKLKMQPRQLYQCMTGQNLLTPYFSYTSVKLRKAWDQITRKTQFVNPQNIPTALNALFRNTQFVHNSSELKKIPKRLMEARLSLFFSPLAQTNLKDHIQNHIITYNNKIYSKALISSTQLLTSETIKKLRNISAANFKELNSPNKKFHRNNNAFLGILVAVVAAIMIVLLQLLPKTNNQNFSIAFRT